MAQRPPRADAPYPKRVESDPARSLHQWLPDTPSFDELIPPEIKPQLELLQMFNPVEDTLQSMAAAGRGDYAESALRAAPVIAAPIGGKIAAKYGADTFADAIRFTDDALTGGFASASASMDNAADEIMDFVRGDSGAGRIPGIKKSTDLPHLRGMPADEATKIAGKDPSLTDAYAAKAQQMSLKPDQRIQPDPDRLRILDEEYARPAPVKIFDEDLSTAYPRSPDPAAALPKGDRARIVRERSDEIAQRIAQKIRDSGQMDADTRYFYHSDGPIYRAAIDAGLTPDEATKYLRDFSSRFAATSPRTPVQSNLLNTTSVMAKEQAGIPHRTVVGPGTVDPKTGVKGISERGYPMMTGKGGIHGSLLDQVQTAGNIDPMSNPKPRTFGGNMAGNRSGVTVDTHAIRGTLQSLNEIEPGSVPEGFILPKFREAYKADPSTLTPDMIDDTLASQMIGPKGATTKAQTEYAEFADVWHKVADELGVAPAEAQSMGWFGMGADTNLVSQHKTVADVFDERIDVTAKALGISPKDAARKVFRREIPLLGVGGAALGLPMIQEDRHGPGGT